jgi:hypothetical protein
MKQGFDLQMLVDDLQPVRPMNWRRAMIAPLVLAAICMVLIGTLAGFRADLMAGNPHPIFLLRGGLLLLLASPGVGNHGHGWKIALAAALLVPFAALVLTLTGQPVDAFAYARSGMECLGYSMATAIVTATPMVLWLRKGAPVSPERAGWLTGLAAGGLGAFAYGFHCPFNSLVYIGIWYGLAVAVSAVAARLIVPRLIRW